MKKFLLILLLSLFTGKLIFAQNSFSITGIVKDQKEGLPGAGVYLSGYKISTVADGEGRFKIANLKPGNYDLLVQMMGYLPYSKNVIISDQSVQVELVLKESTTTLSEVVIRPDPNRPKYLKLFKDLFIGTTPNAAECKILNPEILNIDNDTAKSLLTITTSEFLIIENNALGYRIKYMLNNFQYNSRTKIVYFFGHPFFEEMTASGAKLKKYIDKRETAYHGSPQHFFRSLYNGTANEQGFVLNKIKKTLNLNRYPDSVIKRNLLHLKATVNVKNATRRDNEVISFWTKQQEMPEYVNYFDHEKINPGGLVSTFNENLKRFDFNGNQALAVTYIKEKESGAYSRTPFRIRRPMDVKDYQISVAYLTNTKVRFYENGRVYDPRAMVYEGFWAYETMADTVPMDYIPQKK